MVSNMMHTQKLLNITSNELDNTFKSNRDMSKNYYSAHGSAENNDWAY